MNQQMNCRVNGGNSERVGNSRQRQFLQRISCRRSPARGEASPLPHAVSLTGGGVSGDGFTARTVAVRSSPHLPYIYHDSANALQELATTQVFHDFLHSEKFDITQFVLAFVFFGENFFVSTPWAHLSKNS